MDSASVRSTTAWPRTPGRVEARSLAVWVLAGGLVLYLALDGGGYDLVVRSQAGLVAWWVVLVGAIWGVLPDGRVSRAAWGGLALFAGFVVWTALASTWSQSSGRSLEELSRVAAYLGVLVLGVAIHRDRERAVRHTVNAVAGAVVVVVAVALLSRLRPGLFPAARTTALFLPGASGRLGWPLNYWNALAALVALGLPLLLCVATSARTLAAQAAGAASIPLAALCGYLTFSRGGAIAAAAALIAFLTLSQERLAKLATILVTTAGSAVLIAGAVHRSAIGQGLSTAAARHEGSTLLPAILLACGGVALAQVGIALGARHGTALRALQVSPRRARGLLAGTAVLLLTVALLAGGAGTLSRAWNEFKRPNAAALHQNAIGRFGTASGNGRYDLWKAAVDATSGHLFGGSGPGTYEFLWAQRAPYFSYVRNAHSLYFETLAETGVVGLALVGGFFVLVIGAAIRLVMRTRYEMRARAAALAASCIAFATSAASDWVWQVSVLPVAFLILVAALLAPVGHTAEPPSTAEALRIAEAPPTADFPARRARARAGRIGVAVVAAACLVAIAIPLATTAAVRQSQSAAASGKLSAALSDARAAVRVEPGAASAQLQEALVLELGGDAGAGAAAAQKATVDDPIDWQAWLIASRLDAEAGHARASVHAYRRARALNPTSPLFHG